LRKANSDKDKLFTIISHDLRSPFQPLLGNAQLIMKRIELFSKTDIQAMTKDIYKSARAIFNLLENLLAWSRLEQGRLEYNPSRVELYDLAERTVSLLGEVALGKQIRLEQTIEGELFIQADEYMIDTVIRNLTSNALKFTPAGGQVTLSARRNGLSSDNGATGWVEVGVTDTGVGISREDIDKLFKTEVHHTTCGTAQEKGTGLGLILCQEMVEKNGGRIWIESELGQGTTVKFTVPAVDLSGVMTKNR
jgi:signal transduction histidine kinase